MSTQNRVGRNPFDKGNKTSKAVIAEKALAANEPVEAEKSVAATKDGKLPIAGTSKKVLKTSNKKAETASQAAPSVQETASADDTREEQIIGELIDLPEDHWQPLTAAPAGFIKQLFARWL